MLTHLFVYGTLRRGECRYPLLLPGGVVHTNPGVVQGRLFDFGEYPGMRLSDDPADRVSGEVIEFDNLGEILPALDEEEGADFQREALTVSVHGNDTLMAWTYLLTSEPIGVPRIWSGDWLSQRAAK